MATNTRDRWLRRGGGMDLAAITGVINKRERRVVMVGESEEINLMSGIAQKVKTWSEWSP